MPAVKDKKYVNIAPLGEVLFAKSARAKRLSITIKPCGSIRVAVPARASHKKALAFLQSNIEWVHKGLARIRKQLAQHKATLSKSEIDTVSAKTILLNKLEELAEEFGFSYNRAAIRNQKTIWGSCSAKNNISLNINLIRLKNELIEYVILHELTHTKIKNHRQEFWLELAKCVDCPKKLDRLLRKHQLGL
ncbi:MAG: M48 family metallopeptidase [Anaerohalosphaeraceae bacterium]|nr:M48 family metallopeptidase [Anaerohalosphaeraceae bacterium]